MTAQVTVRGRHRCKLRGANTTQINHSDAKLLCQHLYIIKQIKWIIYKGLVRHKIILSRHKPHKCKRNRVPPLTICWHIFTSRWFNIWCLWNILVTGVSQKLISDRFYHSFFKEITRQPPADISLCVARNSTWRTWLAWHLLNVASNQFSFICYHSELPLYVYQHNCIY